MSTPVAPAGRQAGGTGPVPGRLVGALRGVRRFARGVLGSDAYDRYLHHHRITGCAHAPLSEKEFWRRKYAEQGENPSAGCC
ncbi:YbdD/YjiX family protein [Brachybacterium sp. ACRRE]|uniref:YbdD/YjiX family protein n=1 Tax=Brachybacterium sp. ACRRE TaxID=2918184 RepID=UPI00351D6D57